MLIYHKPSSKHWLEWQYNFRKFFLWRYFVENEKKKSVLTRKYPDVDTLFALYIDSPLDSEKALDSLV